MEAAILNILLTSGKFLKANKITNVNANCTNVFQNQLFLTEHNQ